MSEARPYAYPPRRLRVDEAARYVGLSETAFLALRLPVVTIGRTVGWMLEDLDRYLDQKRGSRPAYADPKAAAHALTQKILSGKGRAAPPR